MNPRRRLNERKKVVTANEKTLRFYQEIYNDQGTLVERHDKFPVDTGHYSPEKE